MPTWIQSICLKGKEINLIPLEHSHKKSLIEAASDGDLWNLWFTSVPSETDVDNYLSKALCEGVSDNNNQAFAVFHIETNKIIGSTRYCNIDSDTKRLEIGYTWYSKSFQKTNINTECKLLLLEYAFEKLNCVAVELRTHGFNHNSQRAIERLGAKKDGILRNHKYDKTGKLRDTVVYSILAEEWPGVRQNLEFKLNKNNW